MTHQFQDRVSLSDTQITSDGFLTTIARSVRTGIQIYRGDEVGRPDMKTVRVYRPAGEVFAEDSLRSFSHAPVTDDHPAEAVTPDNWRKLSVGEVSTAAKIDGEWVQLPLILKDAGAIKKVQDGKRELSAGYTCDLDWTPGTTDAGEAYDAVQRHIKVNHLALVDAARAGHKARIPDGAATWGASPVINPADAKDPDMTEKLQKVTVDGLSVETTDAGAQAITKLTDERNAARTALEDANTQHEAAIKAKDQELATKDAEIDALKAKVLDANAMDAAVRQRTDLIAKALKAAPGLKTDGLTDAEIRRAAVEKVRGADAIKDKSDHYIDAAFDLLEDAPGTKPNPLADKLAGAEVTDGDAVSAAYQEMLRDMTPERRRAAS